MNEKNNKIKLAYITSGSAKDIYQWSGTISFIAKALEKEGIEIYYIDNLDDTRNLLALILGKIYSKLLRTFFKKQYLCDRTIKISKRFAKEIEKRLPKDIDVVFAASGVFAMAFLNSKCKKVMCNDATFVGLINYYDRYFNLCSKSLYEGNVLEQNSFDNCDLLLFASDWAAQSAINDYNIDPSKVKVIPFGANIDTEYTETEIKDIIKNRIIKNGNTIKNNKTDICNLLFIGVDWRRKGGDIALEVAKELRSQDINVHLDIVGIKNMPVSLPDYITNHGFISKKTDEGKNKLTELFKQAHFLLLPTRNECFGVVFSEASSFGLPSITTRTGGVPTAVKDNVNGMTFDLSAFANEYADYIKTLFADKTEYEKLCLSAFEDYKNRVNWDTAGKQIVKAIKEIM